VAKSLMALLEDEEEEAALATPYAKPDPDWRMPELEVFLDSKGVEWIPVPAHALASIDRAASRNNQARLEKLDKSLVESYKAAMESGDKFPPLVVRPLKNRKTVIVDGNHRDEGLFELGAPAHPAYLINATDEMIRVLLVQLNAKHGKQLSEQEKFFHAVHLRDMGATLADAAAAVGLPKHKFDTHYRRVQGERRAEDRGIEKQWSELGYGVQLKVVGLKEDDVFHYMVMLARDAQLTTAEAGAIVTAVNQLRSEAKKKEKLTEARSSLSDRIQGHGGGVFKRKMSANARLSTIIGNIDSLEIRGVVAGIAPERKKEMAVRLRDSARKFADLADELES
jgi:ParB-like nuclease domain